MNNPSQDAELARLEMAMTKDTDVRKQAGDLAAQMARDATDRAADLYAKSARYYEEGGRFLEAAQQLRNAGQTYRDLGEISSAMAVFEQAVRLFEMGGDLLSSARTAEEAGDLVTESSHSRRIRLYMTAKNAYGNIGMYDESASAYLKEMRARRAHAVWRLFNREEKMTTRERLRLSRSAVRYIFWDYSSQYGESLGRLVLVGAALVAIFAVVYWFGGGLKAPAGVLDAIQYSMSVFATFTVGKFSPEQTPAWNLFTIAEALIGAAWQALLLSVLLRQLTRR